LIHLKCVLGMWFALVFIVVLLCMDKLLDKALRIINQFLDLIECDIFDVNGKMFGKYASYILLSHIFSSFSYNIFLLLL
jgi:hypothetical protein